MRTTMCALGVPVALAVAAAASPAAVALSSCACVSYSHVTAPRLRHDHAVQRGFFRRHPLAGATFPPILCVGGPVAVFFFGRLGRTPPNPPPASGGAQKSSRPFTITAVIHPLLRSPSTCPCARTRCSGFLGVRRARISAGCTPSVVPLQASCPRACRVLFRGRCPRARCLTRRAWSRRACAASPRAWRCAGVKVAGLRRRCAPEPFA